MSETLHGFHYEKDSDGIVKITMDMDGPVNAMNDQYRRAMAEVTSRLEAESDLTGVVIASAKKTFFAGGDLKALVKVPKGEEESQFDDVENQIKAPLRRIEKLKVPVVAAINGAAMGGGLEICLAANHRIAWDSPKVVLALPEVTLGLLPGGGGVVRSIHMLGLKKALPLLLEGTNLTAQQAKEIGWVDELSITLDDLIPAAKCWIKKNPDQWAQPWDIRGHKIPGGDVWSPEITGLLGIVPAQMFKKTRGLLPAPGRILAVAGDTMAVDFDTACRIESRGFAKLVTTKEAKNIITSSFFQISSLKKGANRPSSVAPTEIKKVGFIGMDVMMQRIAHQSALSGISVIIKDENLTYAKECKAYSAKLLDEEIRQGAKTETEKDKILQLITATEHYIDLKNCDIIIETVLPVTGKSSNVTRDAESFLAEGGVYGFNTGAIPVTPLATSCAKPDRVIGINVISVVDENPLIEIVCGKQTSNAALAKTLDYARKIRRTAIVVNDSPGFFTARVFSSYLDEGARLVDEGYAPTLINALGRGMGMVDGPLPLGNLNDEEVSTSHAFCDVEKQGEIKDRLLIRQIIESLKCLEEGILRSVAEGNVGSLLGIGAPSWSGGFLQVINTWEYEDQIGLGAFAKRAAELENTYDERFKLPDIVRQKIRDKKMFE